MKPFSVFAARPEWSYFLFFFLSCEKFKKKIKKAGMEGGNAAQIIIFSFFYLIFRVIRHIIASITPIIIILFTILLSWKPDFW